MAVYYALGDALVTEAELYEKQLLGDMATFTKKVQGGSSDAFVEFSTGRLTAANLMTTLQLPSGETVPFEEVGPGKPLTIEIRHVYCGKYPDKTLIDSTKDMLVTSAMKSLATFNEAPRAVNFLEKNVKKYHHVSDPAATNKGTPLVHYTPSLIENNTILTLEISFDEFPHEFFQSTTNIFNAAAGIPFFISASGYLLAAGAITKLLGNLGNRLFDSSPKFKGTEPITFLRAGGKIPHADFRVITEEDFPKSILDKYKFFSQKDGLTDSTGNKYDGDLPYVIISLDGRANDQYKDFTPTATSAVLLEKFFSIKEGQEQPLGPLLDALKLYNDWNYRKKADKILTEIKALDQASEQYGLKKKDYDALIANILDDLLKPK